MAHLREQRLSVLPSPTVQDPSRQLVVQVIMHPDINGSHHNWRQKMSPGNMLNFRYNSEGRHESTHLPKQRLPVVPTPAVQGLPRQLAAQVVSRLDSSSSQHTSLLKVSPCNMLDPTFEKLRAGTTTCGATLPVSGPSSGTWPKMMPWQEVKHQQQPERITA